MLKNKYAQYILVPLLVVIWGTIFYKIYTAVMGEEEELPPAPNFFAVSKDSTSTEDYTLIADYKDPFLGKKAGLAHGGVVRPKTTNSGNSGNSNTRPQNSKDTPRQAAKATDKKTEPAPPAEKPLPEIVYQGWIAQEADTVALLKIDNQYIPNARKGEMRRKVRVEAIFRDSIQLFFEGRKWTVMKG